MRRGTPPAGGARVQSPTCAGAAMGLMEALGLKPAKAKPAATPPDPALVSMSAGAPAGPPAADPAAALDTRLGAQIDAITALLDQVHDDAAAAPARAELRKLI